MVSGGNRWRPLSRRRHLVADRNRGHYDLTSPRHHGNEAWLGHSAFPRNLGANLQRGGQGYHPRSWRAQGSWWLLGARPPMAVDDPWHLQRSGPIPQDLL